jgi:hypothetical protein
MQYSSQRFITPRRRKIVKKVQYFIEIHIYVDIVKNVEENSCTYRVIHERLPMKISLYATQNTRNP